MSEGYTYSEEHTMNPVRWVKRRDNQLDCAGECWKMVLQQLWKVRVGESIEYKWRDVPTVTEKE